MPVAPSPAQSEASRLNGAHSAGPATAAKARSALNGVRHGLSGRTFFLLADEDPAEFQAHEATWLAAWAPRDLHEHEAAAAAIRALWRERRADRLEAQVMTDLFAAGELADEAEARAAKAAAMKALGTLLRYRSRIEREHVLAMQALDALRQRRLARAASPRPGDPEPAAAPAPLAPTAALAATRPHAAAPELPSEPERTRSLNRHQRRALGSMSRRQAAWPLEGCLPGPRRSSCAWEHGSSRPTRVVGSNSGSTWSTRSPIPTERAP
jgi:hypothetical protein